MNFLTKLLFKDKTLTFKEFQDLVRLTVRRKVPGVNFETREYGFVLTIEGKPPTTCNIRGLYSDYQKRPGAREDLIERWLNSLVMEVPEHSWSEAQITLRPTLKNAEYLAHAHKQMQKNTPPDSLPYAAFAGELSVIIMRDFPGTAVAVTQTTLDSWGVTFQQAMQQALNNMNMMSFPSIANGLMAGAAVKKSMQEEVGLVFEGDHLTATWIIVGRFRDYLTQRLSGDYVVFTPIRNRLTAVRADEAGIITQVATANRNFSGQMHGLTTQCFHISASTTGGVVTVYKGGAGNKQQLDPNSQFAAQNEGVPLSAPPALHRPGPVDLSTWGGLIESTEDTSHPPSGGKGR